MKRSMLLIGFLAYASMGGFAQITLSEVCNYNRGNLTDRRGESVDWIELFIRAQTNIRSNYFLTDELLNLQKWRLPDVSIDRDSLLVIFASGEDRFDVDEWHTNFKLDRAGELLILTDGSNVLDSVFVPLLARNYAYAKNNFNSWSCTSAASPRHKNIFPTSFCNLYHLDVSHGSNFYSTPFDLKIFSSLSANTTVYYTTDGSLPSLRSAFLINNSIHIDHTSVINLRAFEGNIPVSDILSLSFFFNESHHTLPVISLIVEPQELFSDSIGIFITGSKASSQFPYYGANYWDDREIAATMDYYDPNKKLHWNQAIDIAINGGSQSRTQAMKSLRLLAKSKYDKPFFEFPFFSQKPTLQSFKRLVLRNSSSDFLQSQLRDPSVHRHVLSHDINVDVAASEACLLYINGQYWGLYDLREKVDEYYPVSNYSIPLESFDLLEEDSTVFNGNHIAFDSIFMYCMSHDLRIVDNFSYVASQIDILSLTDYFITETFFNNTDWPYNNIKYWRAHGGKWRYILIDLDVSFNAFGWSHHSIDHLAKIMGPYGDNNKHILIWRSLLQNPEYRRFFINRYADLLNTAFTKEKLSNTIEKYAAQLANEMPHHLQKWNGSYDYWQQVINDQVLDYCQQRPDHEWQFISQDFKLSMAHTLSFDVEPLADIPIQVNSLTLKHYPWHGSYFPANPISLGVPDNYAYDFVYWLVDGDTIRSRNVSSLEIDKRQHIRAVFRPAAVDQTCQVYYDAQGDVILQWYVNTKAEDKIQVYNIQGQCVEEQIVDSIQGINYLHLEVQDLPIGVYFVKIRSKTIKFIKK